MPTFEFIQENPVAGAGFVYKSTTDAFYYDGSTVTPIRANTSFVAGAGSGTSTMTVTSVTSGGLFVGMTLTGTTPSRTISAFDTFDGVSGTITLSGSATWTSGGTITGLITSDSDYPTTTVPGIVYLDGTYYVMTPNGSVQGSDINDPTSWSALNVIQCQGEPDGGVALARQLNLIVAFNTYSTEFFYNAGNPTGSPLLPYESAFIEVGCAVGTSVAQTDNSLYFIGVTKQKGRGIYRFVGTSPEYLSNPFIDRLLNADDLSNVSAFCVRIGGHIFYILYLGESELTIVYDSTSKQFSYWTTSALLSPALTITAMSYSNKLVTVTKASHGFNDGDLVVIAGVTPTGYNGTYTINVVDDNTFTYTLSANPGTVTVQGTAANYVQSPFAVASYTSGNNLDIIQDSTTGYVYLLDNGTYEDNGNPIEVLIRTPKFDAGNNDKKFTPVLEVIGDKVKSTAYVRYTNDDYRTWSKYRPVDLDIQRSRLNRLGQGRRRAYEVRHHDNVPLRLEALELTVSQGT